MTPADMPALLSAAAVVVAAPLAGAVAVALGFRRGNPRGLAVAATTAALLASLTITFLGRTSGVDYVVKTTTDLSSGFSGTNAPAAVSPQPSGLPSGYSQYEASVDTTSGDRNFLKVDATIQ